MIGWLRPRAGWIGEVPTFDVEMAWREPVWAEHDPRCPCPAHLLEKACRCAERAALRLKREPPARPAPPLTVREAVEGLEALARWCQAGLV